MWRWALGGCGHDRRCDSDHAATVYLRNEGYLDRVWWTIMIAGWEEKSSASFLPRGELGR